MSGWGCPHESQGACVRLKQQCNPGMKGCILHGRFRFADPAKNRQRPPAAPPSQNKPEDDAPATTDGQA